MASYAAADRIGRALPQFTPELLHGFDTAPRSPPSPFDAPLGPPAPGWLPRLLPANGQIVGCSGGAACGLVKATQELFRLQVVRALWVWEFLAGGGPRPCPGAERWRLSELNAQRIRDEIGSVSRPTSGQYGNNPVFSV